MIAHNSMAAFSYITLQPPGSTPQVTSVDLEACTTNLSDPILYGKANIHATTLCSSQLPIRTTVGLWACVLYLFFSFVYEEIDYHCALVHWFIPVGESVHDETGQWVVKPEFIGTGQNRREHLAVVHVDCIARGALLSPVYGSGYIPDDLHFSASLDAFRTYFVNNFADHHMHEFVPKIK